MEFLYDVEPLVVVEIDTTESATVWSAPGELDLKTAQRAIASNRIEAYKNYVSENPRSDSPGDKGGPG
jgi:hypothetical protein